MFLILLLSSIIICTYSAPISDIDTTTLDLLTSSTCPDPTTDRTTWSIVWSCVTTVFLCTWVAIHPNIPPHDATRTAIFVRRLKIMLWAMVAPELIILWALRQWFGAREVVEMFKGLAYNWTRMQAQFAQMGGFILFENNEPVRVLPPEELLILSQRNKVDFPKISEQEIEDRSKNDFFSKVLVIIQTSWFVIQFIARASGRMVITEIEVITLTLAMLNGVMYFLWWNKPLNVRCAIPVHLKSIDLTTICEDLSGENATNQGGVEELENDGAGSLEDQNSYHAEMDNLTNQEHQPAKISHPQPHSIIVDEKHCRTCTNWPFWKTKLSRFLHPLVNFRTRLYSWFSFLLVACTATTTACIVTVTQTFDFETIDPGDTLFYSVSTLRHGTTIMMLTSGLGTLSNAIHCTIWTFPFPSHVEKVLWRTATALLTFLMFLWIGLVVIAPNFAGAAGQKIVTRTHRVAAISIGLLGLVGRLSLLVQAIVSLRDIPASAFETDNWSYMIPHL